MPARSRPTASRLPGLTRRASSCSRTRRSTHGARFATTSRSARTRSVALGPHAQRRGRASRSREARRRVDERVDAALELVGLTEFAHVYPHQLSGGMAQRAALARGLVNDPALLVLDEPFGKLDSLTRIRMQSELVRLWQRARFSVLFVTHDVEEALYLADRVVVFSERPARVVADFRNELPYPRHRDDPRLVALRRDVLAKLGLDV
ncbi:ABC transporter ATP-binding protein [Burkholderia sp. WAC0059]|uniref:ABC transporter ATP-binding protein n=1 Tax=Burkholderia sp. WAC0059 TaxID=2066022 RepID=UPI003F8D81AE